MELALKLAERGKGYTSPNPMVGSVVVKRGKVIGIGWHKKCGEAHAEVCALKEAGKKAKDGIMYVNLEPCSHWGRTPPCTQKIIEAGIREVIIGMADPNPVVDGFQELKFRGIKTKIGILSEKAKKLNEPYIKWMKSKKPLVVVKAAMSLDGRIATRTGDSKYITSKEARKFVHEIRAGYDAVMVGINTVIKDNPQLTVRLTKGRNPIKIVLDSKLKIGPNANVVKNEPTKLIIATTKKAPKAKIKKLQQKGVHVLVINTKNARVDLAELMAELGKREICSIMIEGGAELNAEAIKAGVVDKILIFISPKLIGEGLAALGDLGITKIDKSIKLKSLDYRKIGKDILIEGYL
ncbi:MAG: bifunctional diaminohydroxyphosphoribosylaminopyrimidine deaminase/5-amino-6-(5-phosphoribosylamino)uracil reductase RibD [Nanoarchaeota archaeon]|nr:bifunctional diaminohydroxyphosphoribosylaminopyrimidine deaminase/5-amino-6-(5-phosphoribosylamino)uracil reductase RibD [Nanoarchaeota archaeon]MBU1005915.1 bifunctional diaminohydroxyphosphoribosylaminopyrimidine deaminase/5-amino-6-(5-phosphoribosylamino)uracil reductase RibD [Nanoarchaeota archaeon]MBU1945380.1 bifunctional diaminohydroxyphosphoribosylaminopyrimidine deaminase/5-amino-6-(5-phosphoribosylamino)uracil reductase RibD [Nanoarchaeota archaeon]